MRTSDLYLVALPYFAAVAFIYLSVTWLVPHFPVVPLIFIAIPAAYTVACLLTSLSPGGRDSVRTVASLLRSFVKRQQIEVTTQPTV